jgi:hypothetical protein
VLHRHARQAVACATTGQTVPSSVFAILDTLGISAIRLDLSAQHVQRWSYNMVK